MIILWYNILFCVFPGWRSSVGEFENSPVGAAHGARYCDTRSYFLNGKRHYSLFLRRLHQKSHFTESIVVFFQLFGQLIWRKINSAVPPLGIVLSTWCRADDGSNKLRTYQRGPFNPYLCLRTAQRRTNLISGYLVHTVNLRLSLVKPTTVTVFTCYITKITFSIGWKIFFSQWRCAQCFYLSVFFINNC